MPFLTIFGYVDDFFYTMDEKIDRLMHNAFFLFPSCYGIIISEECCLRQRNCAGGSLKMEYFCFQMSSCTNEQRRSLHCKQILTLKLFLGINLVLFGYAFNVLMMEANVCEKLSRHIDVER
ncbi:CLUMA_CG004558, isoform A [Clunio marinus]|uniref:CLUMA_CG004558, isoform A n=1 Tax=Clunio marinus TaxID=568069 RepID=A0A1J1HU22_9DIPT|nr:CLUMA_CG004558, isoform A [Clunio marinus]